MRWNLAQEGHWCVSRSCGILVNFCPVSGSTNFRQRISRTFLSARRKLAGLGVWPIDTYSPEFRELLSGVPQYHAATCTSPSLMHLFLFKAVFPTSVNRCPQRRYQQLVEYLQATINCCRGYRCCIGVIICCVYRQPFMSLLIAVKTSLASCYWTSWDLSDSVFTCSDHWSITYDQLSQKRRKIPVLSIIHKRLLFGRCEVVRFIGTWSTNACCFKPVSCTLSATRVTSVFCPRNVCISCPTDACRYDARGGVGWGMAWSVVTHDFISLKPFTARQQSARLLANVASPHGLIVTSAECRKKCFDPPSPHLCQTKSTIRNCYYCPVMKIFY